MKTPLFLNKHLKNFSKTPPVRIYISLVLFLILGVTLFLVSKASYQRIGAFGCFDQCFNFVAAYFMLKGKALHSQIFFNHQPLMAYLSYIIQVISNPDNLYSLVLYHRLFILFFSLFMDVFIIWRFRWAGIGFVLFYETTKYYLFGNFFLPEAIVAYLLAYLAGLWWEKSQKKHLSLFDYVIAGLFTWLIVFLRLPYVPIALILYGLLLLPLNQRIGKLRSVSLFLFLLLTFLTLLNIPLRNYIHQVFILNYQAMLSESRSLGINGIGAFKIFLYPFLILFTGKWNYFRSILIGLDVIFLLLTAWFILETKKLKEVLLIFFLLGLAAVRFVEPGTTFYKAFHLLAWYGLFLMIIFLLVVEFLNNLKARRLSIILISFLIALFGYVTLSPRSFIWEKVNREEEFTINYAHYFAHGNVIKILSKPKDTLFLDLWDDLIYWQSSLDSSYQYSLYTPIMSSSQKFTQARLTMFRNNPPDFYYSYPGTGKNCPSLLPNDTVDDYVQLYFGENPSCLYIRKANTAEIANEQWEEIKKLGFSLPEIEDQISAN